MVFIGMGPFGALFGGALADRLGAPVTVAMGAVASIGAAAIFWSRLPQIRVEGRRLLAEQAMIAADPAESLPAGTVEE